MMLHQLHHSGCVATTHSKMQTVPSILCVTKVHSRKERGGGKKGRWLREKESGVVQEEQERERHRVNRYTTIIILTTCLKDFILYYMDRYSSCNHWVLCISVSKKCTLDIIRYASVGLGMKTLLMATTD